MAEKFNAVRESVRTALVELTAEIDIAQEDMENARLIYERKRSEVTDMRTKAKSLEDALAVMDGKKMVRG